MEIIKKNKKLKKRRHSADINKNNFADMPTSLLEKVEQNIEDFKTGHPNDINIRTKHQPIEIKPLNICEKPGLIIEKDEQIKSLTEELQQVLNKIFESKNSCIALKQDLKKAQKLCSEVGENVSVAGLSTQQGGWHGRAEQIQQLQQKNSELQLKTFNSIESRKRSSLDRRSSSQIRNLDKQKKQYVQKLSKDLKDTKDALESTKKKLEAAKARITVLENDLIMSKKAVALLDEKTVHDDQLINALQEQLKTFEMQFVDRELENKRQTDKLEKEIFFLKSELRGSEIYINDFKYQLESKEKEIKNIKYMVEANVDLQCVKSYEANIRETPIKSPDCNIEVNEHIVIGIAAEAERQRLLELIIVMNRRLDKEKGEFEQLSESLKKERIRVAKLEAKLQKMELERMVMCKTNKGSYKIKAPKPNKIFKINIDNPEELRLKYELLEEECLTLKTRLVTIQKNRSADLVLFKELLEHTRKIFKDANRTKLSTIG